MLTDSDQLNTGDLSNAWKEDDMTVVLKPGTRLFSAVCSTQLIAVKAPSNEVELTIGGVSALPAASDDGSASMVEGYDGGTAMGKRYVDSGDTVELLCTKAGEGIPALNGVPLQIKDAKPLPASD